MTYIIHKSDGTTLVTIADGAIDTTACSLSLLGRRAVGYGQAVAENFVRLVENSASNTAPATPLVGQFWYDKANATLKIFSGDSWQSIAVLGASGSAITGDQLVSTCSTPKAPIVVNSSAKCVGLNADLLDGYDTSITTQNSTVPVRNGSGDLFANKFQGVATSALYADLAERFEASEPLEEGDIVEIGGDKEICKASNAFGVLGVISANPAFRMNDGAGDDATHPFVAYVGRVPVKVKGRVKKGDALVLSEIRGVAVAREFNNPNLFVGRALEDKTTEELGLVLAVVK